MIPSLGSKEKGTTELSYNLMFAAQDKGMLQCAYDVTRFSSPDDEDACFEGLGLSLPRLLIPPVLKFPYSSTQEAISSIHRWLLPKVGAEKGAEVWGRGAEVVVKWQLLLLIPQSLDFHK